MDQFDLAFIYSALSEVKLLHVIAFLAAALIVRVLYGLVVDLATAASIPTITVPVTEGSTFVFSPRLTH
jgi:hypothetical protein